MQFIFPEIYSRTTTATATTTAAAATTTTKTATYWKIILRQQIFDIVESPKRH